MGASIRPKQRITPTEAAKLMKAGFSHADIVDEFEVVAPDMAGAAARGIPFVGSFHDEAMGAVKGAGSYLAKKLRGKPTSYGDEYENERATQEFADKQLPGITVASSVASGVGAGMGGLGDRADRLFSVSRAASPAMRAAKTVASGATVGAANGLAYGAGEGTGRERVGNAAVNGMFGAGFGAMFSAAPLMARYAKQYFGADNGQLASARASDAMNRVTQRLGVPDDRVPADQLDDVLNQAGPTITNAERFSRSLPEPMDEIASGKRVIDTSRQMQELGRNVSRNSHTAESQLETIARQRIAQEPQDVADDVARSLGVPAGHSADAQVARLGRRVAEEDEAFSTLFQNYRRPVNDPDIVEAWNDVRGIVMPQLAQESALTGLPIQRLEVQGQNNLYRPTLEGVHRAKGLLQNRIRQMANAQSPDADLMRNWQIAVERLQGVANGAQPALARVPGGPEYLQELTRSSRDRSVMDAMRAGQDMKLGQETGEAIGNEIADAVQMSQGDITTARRIAGGVRRGVVSEANRKAGSGGGAGLLDEFSTPNAQAGLEQARAFQPDAAERGRRFANAMQDRRMMRETNQSQVRGVGQQHVLEGERPEGTALGIGEARTVGELITGNPTNAGGAAKLAAGAMFSKAMQGRRSAATKQAADELARLLMRPASDASGTSTHVFDLLTGGMRRGRSDMRNAIGGSAALSQLFSEYLSKKTR